MQKRWNARDDLIPKKRRERENVKRAHQHSRIKNQILHAPPTYRPTGSPSNEATREFTTWPWCVTHEGPTTSSLMLIFSRPSLLSNCRNEVMLREKS